VDDDDRQRIALWRFGVLGPLVSARLEHGDRRAWFRAAAERVHEQPSGRLVQLSARTIEGWYLAYRRGGLAALRPETRSDAGDSRAIRTEVAELLVREKRPARLLAATLIIAVSDSALQGRAVSGRVGSAILRVRAEVAEW
jgi:hypothetical protein